MNNWFLMYSKQPMTVPLSCVNSTHLELHIKQGASKFHMPSGCIARLPKHKLLSDMSVTLPSDYVQIEMDWDADSFMPTMKDKILPTFRELQRLGASSVPISTLTGLALARPSEEPRMREINHYIITGVCAGIMFGLIYYMVRHWSSQQRQSHEIPPTTFLEMQRLNNSRSYPPSYLPHRYSLPPEQILVTPPSPPITCRGLLSRVSSAWSLNKDDHHSHPTHEVNLQPKPDKPKVWWCLTWSCVPTVYNYFSCICVLYYGPSRLLGFWKVFSEYFGSFQ